MQHMGGHNAANDTYNMLLEEVYFTESQDTLSWKGLTRKWPC